jgi:hypothetical protein
MRVYLNAADIEVTQAGDRAINSFITALNPKQFHIPRKISAYGKQKLDVDFFYSGPLSISTETNPRIELNLSKLNVANDAYSTQMQLYMHNDTINTDRTSQFSMRIESHFTKAYDVLLDDMLRSLISEIYINPDIRTPEMQDSINLYNQEQMYAIIKPSVPNFSSFDKAVQSLDVQYRGNPEMTLGEVTLSDLEFSSTLYGLRAVGLGKTIPLKPPTGNLNIVCSNCDQLINDAVGYLMRVSNTLAYFIPPEDNFTVNPGVAEAVKAFLRELAGPDKTNLTYDIIADEKSGITINGKPINLITTKYYQYIAPALKQAEKLKR